MSDLAGSIRPTSSGSFTAGVCTVSVTINKAYTNDIITVTDSATSVNIQSVSFNVVVGTLTHFVFTTIGSRIAGTAFPITITAEDSVGDIISNYAGSVSFTDTSGTIYLVNSGAFVNGVWTGTAMVTKELRAIPYRRLIPVQVRRPEQHVRYYCRCSY